MPKKELATAQKKGVDEAISPFLGRSIALLELRPMSFSGKHQIPMDKSGSYVMPENVKQTVNLRAPNNFDGTDVVFAFTFGLAGYDTSNQPVLEISAVFGAAYQITPVEGLDAEAIRDFGHKSGMFHVWPFWREVVMTTMARLLLPPLVVPLLFPGEMKFEPDGPDAQPTDAKSKAAKSRKKK